MKKPPEKKPERKVPPSPRVDAQNEWHKWEAIMYTVKLALVAFVVILAGGFWHQQALLRNSNVCPTHVLLGGTQAVNRSLSR